MSKELAGIVKAWEATLRKSQAAAKKRAISIFTTMSVAHVDDDVIDAELYHMEKIFPNDDIYIGQWSSENWPHGPGKFLWRDGCMYVGDWFKGRKMGKGRFSWPSGATYEGQFKCGYMDGEGTYTGSTNDTYRGTWVMNMKHGKGNRDYANGDHYAGEWRRGVPDGQGRYTWNDGNQYIGHWRNGCMSGNGTMMWENGNRYDGCWEDGVPKGNGTYRWGDGSFYVGVWSKDPKDMNGIFYPSSSQSDDSEWDPQQVFADLSKCVISEGEKIVVFPSQKSLNWPTGDDMAQKKPTRKNSKGHDARPRRLSVDGRLSNGAGGGASCWGSDSDAMWKEVNDGMGNLQIENQDTTRGMIRIQAPKRQGETICKGHKNYELMLNLQLGIRYILYPTNDLATC